MVDIRRMKYTPPLPRLPSRRAALAATALTAVAGCASLPEPRGPARPETIVAVTDAAQLIRFNAGQPQRVLDRKPISGLPAGETLIGIDYRVARGVLFALSSGGRLYTVDTATGALKPVGDKIVPLAGKRFGVDFNPVADRIRVVSDSGLNLRLHPDTGAIAATDPALSYVDGSAAPGVVAAGYTYNKDDDKLTTNFAIDANAGTLVRQGSLEGAQPVVSPNTGKLATVGALGTGPVEDASFDIADVNNAAVAALKIAGRTRLYAVDLRSGNATLLGTVGDGRALWGMAIEP